MSINNLSNLYELPVTVTPVDDPPVVANMQDVTIYEGDAFPAFDLDDFLTEVDGEAVTWTWSGNTDLTVQADAGNNVTVSPPDTNWYGTETINFTATDNTTAHLSSTDSRTFTILNVDDPPYIASPVSDVTVTEDHSPVTIDLSNVFADIDNNSSGFIYFIDNSNTSLVTANKSGTSLDLSFKPNQNGTATITVLVQSNSKNTSDNFTVTVSPVDDAPAMTAISDQTGNEGEPFSTFNLNEYITEVDGDPLILSATGQSDLTVNIDPSGLVTIIPPSINWFGSETITFTATDDTPAGLTASKTAIFTRLAVDDPPIVINPLTDVSVQEDASATTMNLANVFDDVDNDNVLITKSVNYNSNTGLVSALITGNTLSINYLPNMHGTAVLVIRATSNQRIVDDTININVTPVDDPPVVSGITDQRILEGDSFTPVNLDNYLTEVDNDNITWTVSGNTDLNVTIGTDNIASVSPPDVNYNGSETIRFTATDNTTQALSGFQDVLFAIDPIDDPPFVSSPVADKILNEDASAIQIDLTGVFDDIDNDPSLISVSLFSVVPSTLINTTLSGKILTITPLPNQNGTSMVTIRGASNGKSADDQFTVTMQPVDDAPVVGNIPDQTKMEGVPFDSFDLDDYLTEVDGDGITWTYTGNTQLSVSIDANNVVTITTPDPHWNGSETLTFTATDQTGVMLSDADNAIFKVDPTDDPPTILNPIVDISVDEDAANTGIDLSNVFTDIDNPDSEIFKVVKANSNKNLLSAYVSPDDNNQLILDYKDNKSGSAVIQVSGLSGGALVTDEFTVTVNPVDDAPVVAPIPGQSINEGETFATIDLNNYLTEYDGDAVNWTWSGNQNLIVSKTAGNIITISTPNNDWNGTENITFTATDQTTGALSAGSQAEFKVFPIDDPPVVASPIPDIVTDENSPLKTIDLFPVFHDIDNDDAAIVKSVILNTGPDLITASISGNNLTLLYQPYEHGNATFVIQAVSNGKSVTDTFAVTVNSVDDPPEINDPGNQTIAEGENFTPVGLNDFLVEHDGDAVIWSVSGQTDLIPVISDQQVLTVATPDADWFGSETLSIRATDQTSNALSASRNIIFTVTPVDDPPYVNNPVADFTVQEDDNAVTIDLQQVFADVDNVSGDFSYSVKTNTHPEIVQTSISGSILTLNFAPQQNGAAAITVQAATNGKTVTDDFTVTVEPVDDPPEIADISPQTISEGGSFAPVDLDSYLSEFDGDQVSWSYSGNTDLHVSIDGTNNAIITTPDENWYGSNTIRFTATDKTANAYSAYKDVTFNVTPVDDPPFVASAINNIDVNEDAEPVVIDLSTVFSDIDNDDAAISKVIQSNTNTSLVSGSLSGNELTLTFAPDANGTANITIRAFSNGKSVDDLFTVNVTAVNDPPAFTLSGDVQVKEDFTTTEQVTVTPAPVPDDETGQSVTYSISPATSTLANVTLDKNSGNISITSINGQNGNQEFTVTADDGEISNNTYTQQFTLTVLPKTEQTITFDPIADRTYGDASFPIFASSNSGLPVSLQLVSGPAELNSNVITITGAGIVTLRATQAGNQDFYAAPAAEQSFKVFKASQVITFDDLPDMTYGDPPVALSATTNAGLPVTFTLIEGQATLSGNLLTITGAGNISVRASQTGNENYTQAGDVIRSFTVTKATQTISFATLQDMKATDPPLLLSATASSGLPVSFTLVSGPASLNGNILTVHGDGTVSVRAIQEGNSNYQAAPTVTRSFTVSSKTGQVITFEPIPDQLYGTGPILLNASSTSGLPVAFTLVSGPATLEGNQLSFNGLGEITVKASQDGNASYNPAQDVTQSFNVTKAPQTITFTGIADKIFGDEPFDLAVSTSSGLDVDLTVVSGPAVLSGKTITITGTGEVVLSASQPGNDYYAAANTVERSFVVQKAAQQLIVAPVDEKSYGDSSFVINASASSGLPVTIKIISGPGVLTHDTVSIIGAGTIALEFNQSGNENYLPAISVQMSVVVSKAHQTIDFPQPEDKIWGDPAISLTATASSGLPVSYQVVSGPATVTGNQVTYTGTGNIQLAASQPGNENYLAADTVYRSFTVAKADQSITFDPIDDILLDEPTHTLNATTTSGLPVTYSIVSGPAVVNGNVLTVTGTGDVVIRATQEGNEHFNPAEPVNRQFSVLSPFTDAALTAIKSPDPEKELKSGTIIHVSVQIKNQGNKTIQNFYVVYNVNNGALISKELVARAIHPGDSLTFIFTDTWTPEDAGTTQFCTYLEGIDNDQNTDNDTLCTTFTTVGIFNPALYPLLSQEVYPNPADDHIIFDMKLKQGITTIMLMDETGKVLLTKRFSNKEGSVVEEINIDSFKPGIYLFRLINEGMIGYGKFIKR